MSAPVVDTTVAALQRQVRQLRAAILMMGLIVAGMVTTALLPQQSPFLRVRGVVIVDDAGHERIRLGASPSDTGAPRRAESPASSLVFLGPDGIGRIIVGELPGSPIDGKEVWRVGGGYGVLVREQPPGGCAERVAPGASVGP